MAGGCVPREVRVRSKQQWMQNVVLTTVRYRTYLQHIQDWYDTLSREGLVLNVYPCEPKGFLIVFKVIFYYETSHS